MKFHGILIRLASVSTLFLLLFSKSVFSAQSMPPSSDTGQWKAVENGLGRSGSLQPDGAYKFSMPRRDLHVTLSGTQVKPGLALGSWAAFSSSSETSMLMGDLVLSESEVEPMMLKLQEGGIQITALHNHLINESPHVMYMHIGGHGPAVKLAKRLHDALALTSTPPPAPGAPQQKLDLDAGQIDEILGQKGKNNGGIYQFGVPRREKITENGVEVPPSMGVATAITSSRLAMVMLPSAATSYCWAARSTPLSRRCAQMEFRSQPFTLTCLMKNRGYSSCISGQMTMRPSWLAACALRWTRPTQNKIP